MTDKIGTFDRATHSGTVDMEGTKIRVIPREVQVDPVRVERHVQSGQGEDLLPRLHHVLLTPDGVTVRRDQDAAVGEELTQTVQVPRHDRPVPGPALVAYPVFVLVEGRPADGRFFRVEE